MQECRRKVSKWMTKWRVGRGLEVAKCGVAWCGCGADTARTRRGMTRRGEELRTGGSG